jgi:hypothetical protein
VRERGEQDKTAWWQGELAQNLARPESCNLCNCSTLNFLIYEENFLFFFISAAVQCLHIEFK